MSHEKEYTDVERQYYLYKDTGGFTVCEHNYLVYRDRSVDGIYRTLPSGWAAIDP